MRYKASKQLQIKLVNTGLSGRTILPCRPPASAPAEPAKLNSLPFHSVAVPHFYPLDKPCILTCKPHPSPRTHLPHRHLNLLCPFFFLAFQKEETFLLLPQEQKSLLLLPIIFCLLNYLKRNLSCSWLLHLQTFLFSSSYFPLL